MRTAFFILALSLLWNALNAQDHNTEQMIRALEQKERQATLEKDTATLRNLWSEDLTVNSPFNRVVRGGRNTLDRPVITQLNYASFERTIEDVLIKSDLAVSMGREVVVEKGSDNREGRTLNRRYTNIWQNQNGQWKLVARHANLVCASQ
jgi:ketosteroid isomerase-like protein